MERREGGEGRRVLLQQRQSIPPSLHLGRHTRTPSVSQFSHHQQHLHSLFVNPSSTIHHQLSTLPMSRSYRLQTDRSTHTQARPVKKKGQRAVSADLLCSRAARMYVRPALGRICTSAPPDRRVDGQICMREIVRTRVLAGTGSTCTGKGWVVSIGGEDACSCGKVGMKTERRGGWMSRRRVGG